MRVRKKLWRNLIPMRSASKIPGIGDTMAKELRKPISNFSAPFG